VPAKDDGARIAQAYLDACDTELRALKPGNVHDYADGHRMTVRQFELSAAASAPVMGTPGLPVGTRIHEAIRRTHAAVGCNTNLGIVLLCAPLASAAFAAGASRLNLAGLRSALATVLANLDVEDAEQAYAAIRLASPAGLGTASEHDVREPARTSLLDAMRAAEDRDRIAAQYARDFQDVFELGVPRLTGGLDCWGDLHWATTSAYLGFLAAFPDSHVARKHGHATAERVCTEARAAEATFIASSDAALRMDALLQLDAALKSRGLNPGTSADLTVASLFALGLLRRDPADAQPASPL
jgi:triphosphoribosyl-dephospho-CoA synthase